MKLRKKRKLVTLEFGESHSKLLEKIIAEF
jgi:hypothetical protein